MDAKRISLFFLMVAVCALSVSAQCSEADVKALEQFDRNWGEQGRKGNRAYRERDVAWFEKHLTDGYMGIAPDGSVVTKAQAIEAIKNDKSTLESLRLTDLDIRSDGDMAVITGVYHMKGKSPEGQPLEGRMRFTRTLVRSGGIWKAVSSHATMLDSN